MNMKNAKEIKSILIDLFEGVTATLGKRLDLSLKMEITVLEPPHQIPKLPRGKVAIYCFMHKGRYLKVGRVGADSGNRYSNQHYEPKSSRSNLAKSILKNVGQYDDENITEENIKDWMCNNLRRVNIVFDKDIGIHALKLFEACLHYQLDPRYEGNKRQWLYDKSPTIIS